MTALGGSRAAATLTTAMLLLAAAAAGAPFSNGSVEVGPTPGGFVTLASGSTAITGWVVRSSGIDYIGSYWVSQEGERSLDLNGTAPGGIEQAFDTVPGQVYAVTFYLAGNPDCGAQIKSLTVGATGNPSASYAFDVSGRSTSAMGWRQETYYFTATGPTTTLFFQSADSPPSACGPALDNVSVREVPPPVPTLLPAGVAVAALAFATLGWLGLTRRTGN